MSTTNPEVTETEWDALQRKFGNLPPKPRVVTEEERTKQLVEQLENVDVLGHKNLKQLKELEDDVAEETLEALRQKRLQQLKLRQQRNRFGELLHLGKDEFVQEVTEASAVDPEARDGEAAEADPEQQQQQQQQQRRGGTWVVLHMYRDSVDSCRQLNSILSRLAARFKSTKFMKALSTDVIEAYPDSRLPTVLLYFGGKCQRQVVGTDEWGGAAMTERTVEKTLRRLKVIGSGDDNSDCSSGAEGRREESEEDSDRSDEERERLRGKGYSSVRLDGLLARKRL
ncbi:hypothetical protein ACSSS7_001779 [Eimeria intestinalis]